MVVEIKEISMHKNDKTGDDELSENDYFEIDNRFSRESAIENMPKWIIHPHSKYRITWDLCIIILLLYTCIEVPFTLGFNIDPESLSFVSLFGLLIDILLCIDIILNFRTAIYDKFDSLHLIVDGKEIAMDYLKGWFWIDLISSVPFDYIYSGLGAIRILKTLKVLKLLRVLRLLQSMKAAIDIFASNRAVIRFIKLIKVLFNMVLCAHYIACLWFWIGNNGLQKYGDIEGENWLSTRGIVDKSLKDQYITSLYWAIVTLFTTGYGDISSTNTDEEIVAIIVIIIGTVFFGYFIGAIGVVISDDNLVGNEKIERIEKATEFCKSKGLSPLLTNTIISHTKRHFESTYAFDDEKSLLDILPMRIRFEIGYQITQSFLSTLNIFDDFDEYIQGLIALKLKTISCNVNIKLFQRGQYGKELFIQRSGIAIESDKNGNTYILRRGDTTSMSSFIKEKRQTTVKCLTWCEYYTLDRDDVKQILKENFPTKWERKWSNLKRRIAVADMSNIKTTIYQPGRRNMDYDFDKFSRQRDQRVMINFDKILKRNGKDYLKNQMKALGEETKNEIMDAHPRPFAQYSMDNIVVPAELRRATH